MDIISDAAVSNKTSSSEKDDTFQDIGRHEDSIMNEKYPEVILVAGTDMKLCEGQVSEDPVNYPDGGLRAWGVVLGGFLIQFCNFGYINSFGVYQDYYTRVYMTAYSASAISWIGGIAAFLAISTGLVWGRIYDRGYCLHLLYGGAFLTSLSLFMLSLVKPNQYIGAFFCQGVGVGLGGGMTYVPSLAIVAHYFDKKRGMAMSMVTAGVPLGSALNPIMINNLLARPGLGFANVARINAAFTTTLLIVTCITMKPRLPPPKTHASLRNCLRRFSTDWAYIALTAAFTFFALGFFLPLFYLQLAATTHGSGETFAFYSLVILNGSGFVARMLCGVIAQRVDANYLAIGSTFVCGCTAFAFIVIGSPASIVVVAVIYGACSGIYVGTMAPLVSMLTNNMAELGLRFGIAFACSGLGELTGSPIAGALLTRDYHWWRPAVFSGAVTLGATMCFVAVEIMVRSRRS